MPQSEPRVALKCPHCQQRVKIPLRLAGQKGRCPSPDCRQIISIPDRNTLRQVQAAAKRKEAAQKEREASKNGQERSQQAQRVVRLVPERSEKRRSKVHQQQKSNSVAGRPGKRGISIIAGLAVVALFSAWLMSGSDSLPDESGYLNTVSAAPVVQKAPKPDDGYRKIVQPFVAKYCADCHSDGVEIADVSFDRYPDDKSLTDAGHTWGKVIKLVRVGAMPPADHDVTPTDEERQQVADWLENRLFRVDCEIVEDPGRVTIRRLNKAEYNNTIRDLVGIDFKPADDFPSDDVGEGFDNNGDVLSLPPLLLEKYLTAAEQVVAKAIQTERPSAQKVNLVEGKGLKTDGASPSGEWRVMSSSGSVSAQIPIHRSGEFEIQIRAQADQAGDENAKMELLVDGKPVKVIEVQDQRKPREYRVTTKLTNGSRRLTVRFINDYYNPKAKDRNRRDRNLYVSSIRSEGPIDVAAPDWSETHRRIISATPNKSRSAKDAALENLRTFVPRAWRRNVDDSELTRYAELAALVTKNGDTFERGMQVAVAAVLVSPHFLFRVESDPDPDDPTRKHRIRDFELASRLSYFLWSSMPDDELLTLARQGRLQEETVLRQQISRMLSDTKANALVDNFASQWLNLRSLEDIQPDPKQFRFDDKLRRDMQTETRMLFRHVLVENRPVTELLDANYTFLNERLAKHYGIRGVSGDEFRRHSLEGTNRKGVLTHGSILTLTSNPAGTSPVKRGKWVLDNILDDAPPEPPADVPALEEVQESNPDLPLREQLAVHRENGMCASCHRSMDAIGFGFENFDAIGRWRTKDGKHTIDPAGELPSGESFQGPIDLIDVLNGRQDRFIRTFTSRMLVYALGRGLHPFDQCALDEITKNVRGRENGLQAIVTEIVMSRPFRQRRGEAPASAGK